MAEKLNSEKLPYPFRTFISREFPPDYRGFVVTSDIDKTYLDTRFETLGGLFKTAVESADKKRTFPGMAPLYRAFKEQLPASPPPSYLLFISASPSQMYRVLSKKFALDQIHPDRITLKRWLKLLSKGRWSEIVRHITYKLSALLYNRSLFPPSSQISEILIGDDSETDIDAYLLYTQIVEEKFSSKRLENFLKLLDTPSEVIASILELAGVERNSRVERIYIHCSKYRRPLPYSKAKSQLVFSALDPLQIALDAYSRGWLSESSLIRVAEELEPVQRSQSIRDAVHRGVISLSSIPPPIRADL